MGKIAYLQEGGLFQEEAKKRQRILSSYVGPENKIDFKLGKSELPGSRSIPEIVRLALAAENEGYDVLILGHGSGVGGGG